MKKISGFSSELLTLACVSTTIILTVSCSIYLTQNQREPPSGVLFWVTSIWIPILIILFNMMLIICMEHDIVEKVALDGVKALGPIIETILNMLPGTKGSMSDPSSDGGIKFNPSNVSKRNENIDRKKKGLWGYFLLPMATLMATITFQAVLIFPYYVNYASNLFIFRVFVFFNSSCFVASVYLTIHLLHGFPLRPWPQVLMLTLFGAYMWVLKAISPLEAISILFFSIPLILKAAARILRI